MGGPPQNLNISMTMYTPPVSEPEVTVKDEKPDMTSELKPVVVVVRSAKMSLKDSIQHHHHHQSTDNFEVTDNMNNNIPAKKVNQSILPNLFLLVFLFIILSVCNM